MKWASAKAAKSSGKKASNKKAAEEAWKLFSADLGPRRQSLKSERERIRVGDFEERRKAEAALRLAELQRQEEPRARPLRVLELRQLGVLRRSLSPPQRVTQ